MRKRLFKIFAIPLLFSISINLFSGDLDRTYLELKEDTLKNFFEDIFNSRNDEEKLVINDKIIRIFSEILIVPESVYYPFDSLKFLGKLQSPDKYFKIYNWNIPFNDGSVKYFCFIQLIGKRKKTCEIIQLFDKSEEIVQPETEVLTDKNWYGALYYNIIVKRHSGRKYYTLLAYDINNLFTRKKIIDVLYFDENKIPHFGAPVFHNEDGLKTRVIFEYSANVVMSMNYFKKKNMIIYDHLSPSDPSYTGQYQYYGPDLSYDAYIFKKGKWNHIEDVEL